MEKSVKQQIDLAIRISRTVENLRKMGAAKITKGAIQARLDGLETNWSNFQEQHAQLLDIAEEKDKSLPYFLDDRFSSTEEEYLTQKGLLLDAIDRLAASTSKETARPPSDQVTPHTSQYFHPLPKINLPTFSGEYVEWRSFRDLFKSLVINNLSISDVDRLHYLKTSLGDEPLQLLDTIEITTENFTKAWDTLTERYENERLLVSARLCALGSLPVVKVESSSALKQLLNSTIQAAQGLESLKRPVQHWDDWFVHNTVERLDATSRRDWETAIGPSTVPPTFKELKVFLSGRIHTLKALERAFPNSECQPITGSLQSNKTAKLPVAGSSSPRIKAHVTTKEGARQNRCSLCCRDHFILHCSGYQDRSPQERKWVVMQHNLCLNCLGSHFVRDCKSPKVCQKCNERHHSSIHDAVVETNTTPKVTSETGGESNAQQINTVFTNVVACKTAERAHVLHTSPTNRILATALVRACAASGDYVTLRALVDPCSEVSFISERAMQTLRLPRKAAYVPVDGIGAKTLSRSRSVTTVVITPHFETDYRLQVLAFILPKVTAYVPQGRNIISWSHLTALQLADPHLSSTQSIDLLLGADIFPHIIRAGLCCGAPGAPIAQKTALGWILTGPEESSPTTNREVTTLHCNIDLSLCNILQRFWTQEEVVTATPPLTAEEQQCDNHFSQTHSRSKEGRYIVRLPTKSRVSSLGDSYETALKMLKQMERRFKRDNNLFAAYKGFMHEYLELEHMTPVVNESRKQQVFLPHHGVFKQSGESSKIRVVFNGSQPTDSGVSLNECLMVGPNLLPDLSSILLRWRRHAVVFSSDIKKMYRQIWVHEEDRPFQCILWRASEGHPVLTYALNTVTYGLACAPYLAVRTLKQLVEDEGTRYPIGADALLHDVYVDDVLSGADNEEEAIIKQQQLTDLLKAGGFPLSRWTSNSRQLLAQSSRTCEASTDVSWNSDLHSLLGLTWQQSSDSFLFQVKLDRASEQLTKRSILSRIAKLYDPLGWLAPCIITAKILIQSLWLLQVGWDDPLPSEITSHWIRFYSELPLLTSVRISRWLGMSTHLQACEIHGFGDASEKAYAAVIYMRTTASDGGHRISLVTAKTRVAPLKQISLPRLELCAADLVASLASQVRAVLGLETSSVHLWSDSSVVLSWLQAHPTKWKTYVANRVSRIQTLVPDAHWHHVTSCNNPADCASRGLLPSQLITYQLWWKGPEFLHSDDLATSPTDNCEGETDLERRTHSLIVTAEHQSWDLVERYSSLSRLLRVTAWCLRFVTKIKIKNRAPQEFPANTVTVSELDKALLVWIRQVQHCAFAQDIAALNSKKGLQRSKLIRLAPFMDETGLLRVGGRLKHSLLDFDERHPLILPQDSTFTRLLVESYHRRTLHGGVQLVTSSLRRRFWIIGARRAIRAVILRCIPCIKWRAKSAFQLMGDLPATRVTPTRPFLHSGVDYAGPYIIRASKGRGYKSYKAYLAIFVCFSTRAVHIELVSDYTTDAFLAAFKRFAARRGICATLTSDCGTNFVGADRELRRMFAAASNDQRALASYLANDGTQWRFHPPAAPHFGGLWEAAVKATKHHLRRVVGDSLLTFEEMSTLLTQVEACLNSRPIQALSDDPEDLQVLTPGHFLIGAALNTIPEPSLVDVKPARLSHWQRLRQMYDHFWRRWSSEYLQSLQARSKWQVKQMPVKIGDLCVIKHETLPPCKWALGRILETHPGPDGHIRVVTIRTQSSTIKRPLVKLCLLPRALEK